MPEDRPAVTLRGFRPSDVPFVSAIVADALHEHYDPGLYPSLSAEWPEGFLVAADPDEVADVYQVSALASGWYTAVIVG